MTALAGNRKPRRRAVLAGLSSMLALPGLARSQPGRIWRLAVVPQLTPLEMTRNWAPVVRALGDAGFACELVVYPSISAFEPEFLRGRADLVYLNPYHMVMARRAHGYEPLLRDRRLLEGLLVVRKEGWIRDLVQLEAQRISFPSPNALAASMYLRALLQREYRLRYDAHYAMNHRNAIRQVLAGDSAAAGAIRTTLEQEPEHVRQALRVIYTTPGLPPHPVAVHPRVPAPLREIVTDTLLGLASDTAGRAIMAALQLPDPVPASYRRDYASIESLQLEKFLVIE